MGNVQRRETTKTMITWLVSEIRFGWCAHQFHRWNTVFNARLRQNATHEMYDVHDGTQFPDFQGWFHTNRPPPPKKKRPESNIKKTKINTKIAKITSFRNSMNFRQTPPLSFHHRLQLMCACGHQTCLYTFSFRFSAKLQIELFNSSNQFWHPQPLTHFLFCLFVNAYKDGETN